MTRDWRMDHAWFDQWIAFDIAELRRSQAQASRPTGNPQYRPQYVLEISLGYLHLLLRMYSRGDPVKDLGQNLGPLLDAWEESERLGQSVWTESEQHMRRTWSVNQDHYIRCFWLVGVALALDAPAGEWNRLVELVGNEGEDALLDRVIASRQPGRRIGSTLCHPKPYQRLWNAVNASGPAQPGLLADFVRHWYADFERPPKGNLSRQSNVHERPYWYDYHTVDGAYFGYWCIEAVAAVKAFGLDDTLCLSLPHYPGDLLRPDGPSTHLQPSEAVRANAERLVTRPVSIQDRLRKKLFGSASQG